MMKISDSALRRVLTAERLASLGLRTAELSNEEILALLTPSKQAELNLRAPRASDDDYDHIPLIEFFCEPHLFDVIPKPVQAFKKMAKWFTHTPAHLKVEDNPPRDQFGAPVMTVKNCMPLLDGMSIGYVISTAADFTIRTGPKDTDLLDIINPPLMSMASTHAPIQVGGPKNNPSGKRPAVKFHNPWVVKTRPGWSTLFVPVLNHMDKRFTCLAAAVDTDIYPKQVNFPAVFHLDNFDEVIPAGTPLVVAIPYRRQTIERDINVRVMTKQEQDEIARMSRVQDSRSHFYTSELRESGKKD
jgi:hypothetical protein